MTARYARAPSGALRALLADGALLAPMRRPWIVSGLPLDLQFRERDEVHLYCGLTRVVAARRKGPWVELHAAKSYTSQACAARLFRLWPTGASGFDTALESYLGAVRVEPRWTDKEGRVQAAWMSTPTPWATLDREAMIGRSSTRDRDMALDHDEVRAATAEVRALTEAHGWARPGEPRRANEVDQLGIDASGRLVLVELKHGRASDLATAPLQVLRYTWEWHAAVESLVPSLVALWDARRALGLLANEVPPPRGEIRVVLAWGEMEPSPEMSRRLTRVLDITDTYLPPGVSPIEVWTMASGRPTRVR